MSDDNFRGEPTQRDYQSKIMSTLMRFFRAQSVEDFSVLMQPDNEHSILLNTAMQRERPVLSVDTFSEDKEVEIEDHNSSVTELILPEGTLVIEYGQIDEESGRLMVYVWKDDSGVVNYGVRNF